MRLIAGLFDSVRRAYVNFVNLQYNAIVSIISDYSFEASVGGELSVGVQLAGNLNAKGKNVGAKVNIASVDLVRGGVSTNKGSYVSFVGDGGSRKVSQSLAVSCVGIGASFNHNFETTGYGALKGTEETSVGLGVGFVSFNHEFQSKGNLLGGEVELNKRNIARPSANFSLSSQQEFHGLDCSVTAAFILGIDLNLKLGYSTPHFLTTG